MTPRSTSEQAAAQRKERLEGLQRQLTEGVERLTTSEGWKQMLGMASKLHRYSANNVLLVMLQRPDTTAVAGYRTWQGLGRQVKKGSEAIWVLGPMKYKVEIENEDTGEKQSAIALRGFKPVPVFAIEDTDGPELPTPTRLTGEAPAAIWDGVVGLLQEAGYTVVHEPIASGANGDTDPRTMRVRVDSRLAPMQALKTLVHEKHHVSLAHVDDLEEYRRHRGTKEVEAESATFVALGALGIDTSSYSFGYVAHWANGDTKLLMTTAERVVSAAHQTVDQLTLDNGLEVEGDGFEVAL